MNTPAFSLTQPRSLLTITRAELEEAPIDWVESMRRKLAAQHGVDVEQVCFDQMSYADRAIYGEFRVRKAVAAPASPKTDSLTAEALAEMLGKLPPPPRKIIRSEFCVDAEGRPAAYELNGRLIVHPDFTAANGRPLPSADF